MNNDHLIASQNKDFEALVSNKKKPVSKPAPKAIVIGFWDEPWAEPQVKSPGPEEDEDEEDEDEEDEDDDDFEEDEEDDDWDDIDDEDEDDEDEEEGDNNK